MTHRLVALTAVAAIALTGGCGAVGDAAAIAAGPAAAPAAEASPTPGSEAGGISMLPDPCTLLDRDEVEHLTSRPVTQIDEDGADAGDATRYCQWQQEGGQLAIFLSPTTGEDFRLTIAEAEWVDGVGQDAYWHSGHLFVLHGDVQIDVYSRGASDARNLSDARSVAATLIERL